MTPPAESAPRSPASPQAPASTPWPVHPFLAAIPSLLSYTHDNRGMAFWTSAIAPLVATWVAMLPVWGLLRLVSKSRAAAAFSTTLVVIAFYAHQLAGTYATSMWVAVFVASLLLSRLRGEAGALTTFANLMMGLAILPRVFETIQDQRLDAAPHVRPGWQTGLELGPPKKTSDERPDIWYIVLDAYGREDVLREQYGIESGLADQLRTRGFVVAKDARSNYAQTSLSFAATMNMAPLQELLVELDPNSTNRRPLMDLIQNNRVVSALRAGGYRIVGYAGEYSVTKLANPDEVRGPRWALDEYDYVLLGKTPILALTKAAGFPQHRIAQEAHRLAVQAAFDALDQGDRAEGPTFHYVHIVAPHPPFVFAADGSYRKSRSRNFFGDGATWEKYARRYKESYEAGYAAQAAYVDRRLLAALDGILADSSVRPIVLVQGDHGPGSLLDWNDAEATDMHERMGILSAYLLPDPSAISPSITPVDSFRVVLNQALGTSLPLIGGKSWFSSFSTPYNFVEVTDRLNAPRPIPPNLAAPDDAAPKIDAPMAENPEQ